MIEIERKFLVDLPEQAIRLASKSYDIFQGYISDDPERTVRVRIRDKQGFINIKGISSEDGSTRKEWEQQISLEDAHALKSFCLADTVHKTRHLVPHGRHVFEVDVFGGNLKGLVLAEVELSDINEEINLPAWLGEEVTADKRYYNSYLAKHGKPA